MPKKIYTADQEAALAGVVDAAGRYAELKATIRQRIEAEYRARKEAARVELAQVVADADRRGVTRKDLQEATKLRNWDRFKEFLSLAEEPDLDVSVKRQLESKPEIVATWGWTDPSNPRQLAPFAHALIGGKNVLFGTQYMKDVADSSGKINLTVLEIDGHVYDKHQGEMTEYGYREIVPYSDAGLTRVTEEAPQFVSKLLKSLGDVGSADYLALESPGSMGTFPPEQARVFEAYLRTWA